MAREFGPSPESKPGNPVDPRLAEAYTQYMMSLSPEERAISIENCHGQFVPAQLAEHMLNDTEVGRNFAETMILGTKSRLEDQGISDITPEQILEKTIADFNKAAARREQNNH